MTEINIIKYFQFFIVIGFFVILTSCRTVFESSAWGICGYDDPVNECEWMKSIIRQNRTTKLAISEVWAEKHIIVEEEGIDKYVKLNGFDHAYMVRLKGNINSIWSIYDCEGNIKGRVNYVANGFVYYSYYDTDLDTYIHCHILETNVIYDQE